MAGRLHAVLFVLLAAAVLAYPSRARAATENVFVVVVDGLRNSEAFDDPQHRYIPKMWNRLRPRGTILRDLQNPRFTWASPAKTSLWTGAWEHTTWANENNQIPAEHPTMFEYLRRQLGISKDKVVLVSGKAVVLKSTGSLDPEYLRQDYGANEIVFPSPLGQTDNLVYNEVINQINTTQPKLCFVDLGDVDIQGHSGIWGNYTAAIKNADNIVYNIASALQASDHYRDKTALIVLTDKGRHDRAHGGFRDHGDLCDGCTSCFLLAIGPSVQVGKQDWGYHELVDITPTVGAMLGFATPKSEGFPIASLLSGVAPVTGPIGEALPGAAPDWTSEVDLSVPAAPGAQHRAVSPDIACWKGGDQVHVVWCDDASGTWQVWYALSNDCGATWSAPVQISSGLDGRATHPAVAVDDSSTGHPGNVYVVWEGFRGGASQLLYRSKDLTAFADSGWGAEAILNAPVTSRNRFRMQFLQPDVAVDAAGGVHIVVAARDTDPSTPVRGLPYGNRMAIYYQFGDGETWSAPQLLSAGAIASFRPRVSCDDLGDAHVVWESFTATIDGYVTHDVKEMISYSTSASGWAGSLQLTDPAAVGLALTPDVAALGSEVHTLWVDGRDGTAQLFGRTWLDTGFGADVQYSSSPRGVWDPDLVMDGSGALVAVAEDYGDSLGGAEVSYLRDDGLSRTYERLTANTGLSTHPAVALDGAGRTHVVFQDNRSGNWEISYSSTNSGMLQPEPLPRAHPRGRILRAPTRFRE